MLAWLCLERGADLHTAQLMPLPLTVFCFSKIQIVFTFLIPAYLVVPDKGPLNGCGYFDEQTNKQTNKQTSPGKYGGSMCTVIAMRLVAAATVVTCSELYQATTVGDRGQRRATYHWRRSKFMPM